VKLLITCLVLEVMELLKEGVAFSAAIICFSKHSKFRRNLDIAVIVTGSKSLVRLEQFSMSGN
jgi:hypothetical protein